MPVVIRAVAYHLPERIVTNADLAAERPDWDFRLIEPRSGVLERRIAAPDETALDLGQAACERLLDAFDPGVRAGIDGLLFCTETPDHPMPPNACLLQDRLGLAEDCAAFDITLGCSGFVYALTIAEGLIAAGRVRRMLVVTADTYSRFISPGDRAVRTLFGDAAAAALVEPAGGAEDGFLLEDVVLSTQGRHFRKFYVPAGGARQPRSAATAEPYTDSSGNTRSAEQIHMDGLGVLGAVTTEVPRLVRKVLERNGLTLDDIGLVVPHQGSRLALQTLRRVLKLPEERVVENLARVGNTVSASVPIALADAWAEGRAEPGALVLLCAFGLGFSNGVALCRRLAAGEPPGLGHTPGER